MFFWNGHRGICESALVGCVLVGLALVTTTARAGEIALVPVDATGEHTIVDNEITLTSGNQQVTLEIRVSGWSPDQLGAYGAKVDSSTYASGAGTALTPLTTPDAAAGAFIDEDHADFVFPGDLYSVMVSTFSLDYEWLGAAWGTSCADDGGGTYYGGTLILEIPGDAAGTYTLELSADPNYTFINDCPGIPIPSLTRSSALITLPTVECGNGAIEGSEECDDGDTVSSDGCSSTCTVEDGWDCSDQPSVCEPSGDVPAVSEWGLVAMILLVLTAGSVVIRRQRRAV